MTEAEKVLTQVVLQRKRNAPKPDAIFGISRAARRGARITAVTTYFKISIRWQSLVRCRWMLGALFLCEPLMEVIFASRAPEKSSAGWQLQKKRPNEFGYVDEPIEARGSKSWERDIPDVVRKQLEGVDLTSIRPSELKKLARALYREGYVSNLAATQLTLITLDVDDHPQDMIPDGSASAQRSER